MYYGERSNRNWGDILKVVGVVAAIAVIVFFLTDFISGLACGKSVVRYGKVHDKQHEVWHTTDDDGHRHKHESWTLKVCVAGEKFRNIGVSHSEYDNVTVQDFVRVSERYGGITGWSYGYSFGAKVDPKTIPGEGVP
jgi:hypothetical protein